MKIFKLDPIPARKPNCPLSRPLPLPQLPGVCLESRGHTRWIRAGGIKNALKSDTPALMYPTYMALINDIKYQSFRLPDKGERGSRPARSEYEIVTLLWGWNSRFGEGACIRHTPEVSHGRSWTRSSFAAQWPNVSDKFSAVFLMTAPAPSREKRRRQPLMSFRLASVKPAEH